MTADDLRRFARRDWTAAANGKRDYWAEQFQRHGAAAARMASAALLLHMRRMQPDFPTRADRLEDLAAHQSLRQRLDRAAHAFTGR